MPVVSENCQGKIDFAQKELDKIGMWDWLSDITLYGSRSPKKTRDFFRILELIIEASPDLGSNEI